MQLRTPSGILISEILVTPTMAAEWLTKNAANRNVQRVHVTRIASDIRHDKFQLTHQGVAFDLNGVLVDGQHRLHAILEANKAVKLLVFFDLPIEVREVVDFGKARSAADVLRIAHHRAIRNEHVAVATHMMPKKGCSESDKVAFYLQHEQAILLAMNCIPKHKKAGIAWAPSRAAFAKASYHADLSDLRTFAQVLNTGCGTDGERDHVVVHLRDRLQELAKSSSDDIYREMYRLSARALESYLNREMLKMVRDPRRRVKGSDGNHRFVYTDPFPLPETFDVPDVTLVTAGQG